MFCFVSITEETTSTDEAVKSTDSAQEVATPTEAATTPAPTSTPTSQTDPPSVAIADLFPNGGFPVGEIQEYKIADDQYVSSILMTIS